MPGRDLPVQKLRGIHILALLKFLDVSLIFSSSSTRKQIIFFADRLTDFTEISLNSGLVVLPDLDDALFIVVAEQLTVLTDNGEGGEAGGTRHEVIQSLRQFYERRTNLLRRTSVEGNKSQGIKAVVSIG